MKTVLKDRKGQSLVLFVLLLPLILGIMILVFDIGNAQVEKNKTNNTIEMILEIALEDNLQTAEIQSLLRKNLENHQSKVTINDNKITIISDTYIKGVFSKTFGFQGFEVRSEYVGEKINNKITITKKG